MHEEEVEKDAAPVIVTNSRGLFIQGRISSEGVLRCAFFECPVEEEGLIMAALHRSLIELSSQPEWPVRCNTIQDAVGRLQAAGSEPRSIVLPSTSLPSLTGLDPEHVPQQGYVTTVDGVRTFTSDLPEGSALVFGAPLLAGVYTRVGDYVGVAILRADRAVMAVLG
jgi:hypothetical protein